MGLKTTRIAGADDYAKNSDGAHFLDAVQVAAKRAELHKISIHVPATAAGDVFVWIFDLAAGDANSVAPVHVRGLAPGQSDTWDFGASGSPFKNGIYVGVGTNSPVTPATKRTPAGNDQAVLKIDFRIS
jgi:hypothetical protein